MGAQSTREIFSAAFTITPNPALLNQAVTFDASPSLGRISQYEWDFGDGTGLFTGKIITHSFTNLGTYLVTLTISHESWSTTSDTSHSISIESQPPIAAVTITSNPALVNQLVTFDATASSGVIVEYQWDFGDGTGLLTGKNITHSFKTPGTYLVTLTVTDEFGLTNAISSEMLVNAAPVRGILLTW